MDVVDVESRTPVETGVATALGSRVSALIYVVLVVLFVPTVIFLRDFKPEAAGFDQRGPWLVLYHLARLGLALSIAIACYALGYHVLEWARVSPRAAFDARKTFILCFFFGASAYGIAFTILGLAGAINLATGLAFTIPALILANRPLRALSPTREHGFKSWSDTHASRFFVGVVVLSTIAAVVGFILTRVVFVATQDGNVWEHYLHYYRSVLASGSTWPNEVWHHFYSSKAGGLVFLTNVLSDFFGVQLVSACFLLVTGLIVFDLLIEYAATASWAFAGVTLYFTYLFGDVSSGTMVRVHGVLLGYAGFVFWGSVRLQSATATQRRGLMIAMAVGLAYAGFYFPVATALFPLALLLSALSTGMVHDKAQLRSFAVLSLVLAGGSVLAIATNWIVTGLPEVTPIRWFWAIADRAKVERVFGTAGVNFFLDVNNDFEPYVRWYRRIFFTIRYPLPKPISYVTLVAAGLVFVRMVGDFLSRRPVDRSEKLLVQLVAFLVPLGAFAVVVPSPSVYRMGIISITFVTLAVVLIWKTLVDRYCRGIWVSFLSIEYENGRSPVRPRFRLWYAATALLIVAGIVAGFSQAVRKVGRQRAIISAYASGTRSLKATVEAMEVEAKRPPGATVAAMSEFRRIAGGDGRVLSLAYDPGYAYTLPDGGIISEPTYSIVRNRDRILVTPAREVAAYLQQRNIRYLAINLPSRLFSTIAFTPLFDANEMPKYLTVAYRKGDFVVLTWRQSGADEPLPEEFLTLFELKRSGVLHYPFTKRFAALMTNGESVVDGVTGFERVRAAFQHEIEERFLDEVFPLVTLEASRSVLRRILSAGQERVGNADPGEVLSVRRAASGHIRINVAERELRKRLLELFTEAISDEYAAELGEQLAVLSRRCDERVPFARVHPPDAICR